MVIKVIAAFMLININFVLLNIDMGVASQKPGVGSSWKSSTLLVLNECIIRKIAEYPSYMSAFLAKIDQKSTFFWRKTAKK